MNSALLTDCKDFVSLALGIRVIRLSLSARLSAECVCGGNLLSNYVSAAWAGSQCLLCLGAALAKTNWHTSSLAKVLGQSSNLFTSRLAIIQLNVDASGNSL